MTLWFFCHLHKRKQVELDNQLPLDESTLSFVIAVKGIHAQFYPFTLTAFLR